MAPDGSPWEAEGVLNPGAVRDGSGTLLLYPRMVALGNVSRIGLARLGKSAQIERIGVLLEATEPYELRSVPGGYGCEDARITHIPILALYVMTYTAFGPGGARIAVAISRDAHVWQRLGLVDFNGLGLNAVDNKDAAYFPEPVRSPSGVLSLAFFHRPMRPDTIDGQTPIPVMTALAPEEREVAHIAYVPLEHALRDFAALCRPSETIRVLPVGADWGRLKNGAGTPPVRTKHGWVSVFHGVDAVERAGRQSLYYSAGILINALEYPHHIVYRSPEPVLVPETAAERFGTVDDVVFPTGIDSTTADSFDIYYGAADAKISHARIEIVG